MNHACVIGWPIHHSKSPLIHTYWIKKFGLEASYDAKAIHPDEVHRFFATFKQSGLKGINVTLPYKETTLKYLDVIHSSAKAIGAANTLWIENDKLHGMNTDADGFIQNLNMEAPNWQSDKKAALVLGAGGASKAIVYALKQEGFKTIYIANRTKARAQELATTFGDSIQPIDWDAIEVHLDKISCLVNTTSLGMVGKPPLEISLTNLSSTAVVTDIVYTPLITPLLQEARARGNTIVDGLGMLLHQAVPGFEKWFGKTPTVTPQLRTLILQDKANA